MPFLESVRGIILATLAAEQPAAATFFRNLRESVPENEVWRCRSRPGRR
jgi:hypothetical protein